MALKRRAYTRPPVAIAMRFARLRARGYHYALASRRVAAVASKDWAWARLEPPSVQILVVVANTLARPWRTDVEKGFV
jgi:hypothetical protein